MDLLQERRRLRRLAAQRTNDSICTFVRALDYRRLDTKVIRAVWEHSQHWLGFKHRAFPLRPSDRFEKDLRIDGDDLDDIAIDAAKVCGRDLSQMSANPYFGKVDTFADLIQFLCSQPKM